MEKNLGCFGECSSGFFQMPSHSSERTADLNGVLQVYDQPLKYCCPNCPESIGKQDQTKNPLECAQTQGRGLERAITTMAPGSVRMFSRRTGTECLRGRSQELMASRRIRHCISRFTGVHRKAPLRVMGLTGQYHASLTFPGAIRVHPTLPTIP